MKVLKQVVGIDVSQGELVCQYGALTEELSVNLPQTYIAKNSVTGFTKLLKWAEKLRNTNPDLSLYFVMEATGIYHEQLAHWLSKKGCLISIVLPNKISNYQRTLDVKTITDKTASEAIARFGLSRNLEIWSPPKPIFRILKQLTRERDQLVNERVVIKNQLHAEKAEAYPNKNSIKRLNQRLVLLSKQEKQIKAEISTYIEQNKNLKEGISRMTSIPGVGELTATILLAETNGFELIRNKKQLTSYAGLDVIEKQSGTSVQSKQKISKKGNRHIRKAMHLPSLSSVKYNDNHKKVYARLVGRHGIKMKGLVAIQRKILELMYILYKNQTVFDNAYELKKRAQQNEFAEPFESSIC